MREIENLMENRGTGLSEDRGREKDRQKKKNKTLKNSKKGEENWILVATVEITNQRIDREPRIKKVPHMISRR